MLPDLAHQLGLDYLPHRGEPYKQTYVVPGTVDPAEPTHEPNAEAPVVVHAEQHMESVAGFEHIMNTLFEVFHRAEFEYAGPYTIGGKSQAALAQVANVTGIGSVYTLANPWDNDAEFCCLAASFGAAGQAVLSKDPYALGPALTQTYDGSTLARVMPFFASGVTTLTYGNEYWFPIPASDSLYWAVNMVTANTNSALATIAFRRRINRHGRYYLTIE